jgi:hypothetical protein
MAMLLLLGAYPSMYRLNRSENGGLMGKLTSMALVLLCLAGKEKLLVCSSFLSGPW